MDRSLAAATRALVAAQSPDGAWRSHTYGAMKDGLSITPPILKAVVFGPAVPGSEVARQRGAEFLVRCVRADGTIAAGEFGLGYPVYTAATAAIVLTYAKVPDAARAREAWMRELRSRQLTEQLGWSPTDLAYGGWGDSVVPTSNRNEPRQGSAIDADLSSTLFAVGALRVVAGAKDDDPALRKALDFVERCQNYAEDPSQGEDAFDDGGFHFSPVNPMRNKAGEAGTDKSGRLRFHSYGSTTADGLRALLRCGASMRSPRVLAARKWLERHFSVNTNPGEFDPGREVERDATYYYYCWSLAHAFRALGIETITTPAGPISWADALSHELIRRQHPDGTWVNRFSAAKEDDPLVATTLVAGALGSCRLVMPR
ncbi:MAG TPA: prenyltransferase/squalene oxidase repeat-containing protein [Isosphaeraceae bacterium]|nr:prenyltransferase/squalene oxidase repeat-containing protein [Isosphaeraceae bacterium]